MRILGIDPGSQRTGVGIIDVAADGRVTHVHHQPLVLLGAHGVAFLDGARLVRAACPVERPVQSVMAGDALVQPQSRARFRALEAAGWTDAIRAQLTEMGWSVTDTAQGPKIAKL